MKTIAVMAHKGGVGKTTLTLNLAMEAIGAGQNTAIIDLDPQASAEFWSDQRQQNTARTLPDPVFFGAKAIRLRQTLDEARSAGCAVCFIDTPPRMDAGSQAVAELADFLLVPVRPSAADTHAIIDNLNIADQLKKPGCAVLNGCPPSGSLAAEIANTIAHDLKFPVAPEMIGQRVAFARAFGAGLGIHEYEPGGKSAEEVSALWRWLAVHLRLSPTQPLKEAA